MDNYNELVQSAKDILKVKEDELNYVLSEAKKVNIDDNYIDEVGLSWKKDIMDAKNNYMEAKNRYEEVLKIHERC